MIIGGDMHLAFAVGIKTDIQGFLRIGLKVAPAVKTRLAKVHYRTAHAVGCRNYPLVIADINVHRSFRDRRSP